MVGLTRHNVLFPEWGGAITWDNGTRENLPANTYLGAAMKILDGNVLIALEAEIPYAAQIPTVYHVGSEFKTGRFFAFRIGANQKRGSVGSDSSTVNITGGVGLDYHGLMIDYAYHPYYTGFDETVISTVSISFVAPEVAAPAASVVSGPSIIITFPSDESVVYEDKISITGKMDVKRAQTIKINNVELGIDQTGEFTVEVGLAYGKNALLFQTFDAKNSLLETNKLRILKLISFKDVPEGHWAREQISTIATLGLINGYPDGTFRPEGNVSRAEMAALLTAASGNDGIQEKSKFKDMYIRHWATQYVNVASEKGWVTGYPDGTFKPSANINRAEGVVILSRFAGIAPVSYTNEFEDVPPSHWAADKIASAKAEGLLDYMAGMPFRPNQLMTRAEVAEILYRTKEIKDMRADLFDFARGY